MAQVAVTVLHVDEVEAGSLRTPGGAYKVIHQRRDLVVGERGMIVGDVELAVEDGMPILDDGLKAGVFARPRESA
jgi:hypothetical protein